VLFFRSGSCLYCDEVKLVLDEVCCKYRRQLEVVTVDMDQEDGRRLARQYGIVGIPTVLLLDSEGHQVNVLRGTLPKAVVEQTVKDLVGN
jgi:thioredoxin-like negative regulator of GroEL